MEKDIPIGWGKICFKDACDKISLNGIKLKEKEYEASGKFPVVDQGQRQIGGYFSDDKLVVSGEPPFVIFGDHTKVKKYINFKFIAGGDGLKVLKPKSCFDPKLFYYFIHSIKLPDKGYARHFQYLEKSEIKIPPLLEQHRIVSKIEELFSELDNGIESLKKAQQKQKLYRQAVLKWAFESKLKSKVEKDIRSISSLVTSGSRGWAKYYSNEGAKFIRIGNLTRDDIELDLSKIQHVRIPEKSEGLRSRLKEGNLLISITADLGSIAVVPCNLGEAYINQHIAVVNINDSRYSKFIAWFLKCEIGRKRLLAYQRGATKKGLGLDDIRDVVVPYPEANEVLNIVQEIEFRFSVCDKMEESIEQALSKAEALRQSILKKAFEGKLVPQDLNDEPAEKLLERIRGEKDTKSKESKTISRRNRK